MVTSSTLVPFRARWLDDVGLIFFFFNISLFVTNTFLLVARFRLRPGSFRHSFVDQVESLFIPAFVSFSKVLATTRAAIST